MKIIKTTLLVMSITILSKGFGFFRDIYLASSYGTSIITDIYFIALTVPEIIFYMIINSFTIAFIPTFFKVEKEEKDTNDLLNNSLNIILIISIFLSIVGLIFTKPIIKLLAIGFDDESIVLTVKYTRMILPVIILIGIEELFEAFLKIKNNFSIPVLLGIPKNIILIISIYLSIKYDIKLLFYGIVCSVFIQLIILIPIVFKYGYRYKSVFDFKNKYMKNMIYMMTPVMIGLALKKINVLVDKSLASTLAEGSISALNFAHKIDAFVFGVFLLTISTIVFRNLSLLNANNRKNEMIKSINKIINSLIMFLIPMSVGMFILSEPIVKVLLERGSFGSNATGMTYIALSFYSLGIVGYGLREVLINMFYSLGDTKTPMINSIFSVGLNILLNFILIKKLAHGGLALATSIASIFGTILLIIKLKAKLKELNTKKIYETIIISSISSIIMGIVVKISYDMMISNFYSGMLSLVLIIFTSSILGIITYGIFIWKKVKIILVNN